MEQVTCKSQNGVLGNRMREMWGIRVGMQEMRWECRCGESAWECGESEWRCKNVRNQGGYAGN